MTNKASPPLGRRYRIRGQVQGVGFRPFVWRIAREEGISGHVLNDGGGVLLEAFACQAALDRFELRLTAEAPPLARIDGVDMLPLSGPAPDGFAILESRGGAITTGVAADAAVCEACLAEVFAPDDRRAGYAFTNCTHCGPRLSIVHAIPYDRTNTAMAAFPMCPACYGEYSDPADRRFHAEPTACPVCGPRLWLEMADGQRIETDPITATAAIIARGGIVAVKGIGGFHLACDATSGVAVDRLRARKRRDAKPFAVMVRDLAMARTIATVSGAEARLLASPAAPIVLLAYQAAGSDLAPAVAPGSRRVGLMLPATPLHHLLLRAADRPLIMTSGNMSSEPQCIANDDARSRLAGIADAWLMHDRDIVNRLDDSVVRVDAHGQTFLRRARGYAPQPLRIGDGFADIAPVLAMGGELKATFCALRNAEATVSQHLGDLGEPRTFTEFRSGLDLYRRLFQIEPRLVAVDCHPDYAATRMGEALAREAGAGLVAVQHHHAHLASCLADNGIGLDDAEREPTLGIILDGTGLGSDGTIWGCELLLGGYRTFERVGHLKAVPLPGGAQAIREPWRMTYSHLTYALGRDWMPQHRSLELAAYLVTKPLPIIDGMMAKGINAPLTSSAGRLFDAVAAAVGICRDRQAFEGQTGMTLEALAEPYLAGEQGYPFALKQNDRALLVDPAPMWQALIADLMEQVPTAAVAARFHLGFIEALSEAASRLASVRLFRRVALSGGVFANRILLDGLGGRLKDRGFSVLVHRHVPANDGGLSLGQACIAAAAAGLPGH